MGYTREQIDHMSDKELLDIINSYLDQLNPEEDAIIREMIEEGFLYVDFLKASEGKRDNERIQNIIGKDFSDTFVDEDSKMRKAIRNVQLVILSDSFRTKVHTPKIIHKANKDRMITVPYFEDEHVIQHALIRVILPRLMKGMYIYSCASIPGRGIYYAQRKIVKAIQEDPTNTRYCLKMDIRHFFDSIPHRILKRKIRDIVKEPTIRKLLFRMIDTTEVGVPLGFYTSPWLANYYLQDLDHYIKERILDDCDCNTDRTKRHGAPYYYRYMDDMVIFGPSKKELHRMRNRIEKVLNEELGLQLKYNWQVFRFDHFDKKTGERKGKPLDFIGFRFYHDKVTLRKSIYKRILGVIRHLKKMGVERLSFHDAMSFISYYGMIYWTDSKGLYRDLLRPYITLKQLKKIVKRELRAKRKALEANNAD